MTEGSKMSECKMTKAGKIEMLNADIEALEASNMIQPEKAHTKLVLEHYSRETMGVEDMSAAEAFGRAGSRLDHLDKRPIW